MFNGNWLAQKCRVMVLIFAENCKLQLPWNVNPIRREPCQTIAIQRDGNCLFTAFSYLVSGNALNSENLRRIISGAIETTPFSPIHFIAQQGDDCATTDEYLRRSKVNENGIYGGDVELVTFCTLFEVDVVVFVG